MRNLAPLLLLPFLFACPPSEGDDTGASEGVAGGNFDFMTTGVDDQCSDGALNVVYLPDGAGTTNDFGAPIYIPGDDELPYNGSVDLPDPFTDVTVDITGDATAGTRAFAGAQNTQVDLDPDTYADCKVDIGIAADCTLSGADAIACTATLEMSSATGADCPTFDSDPCTVTLDISGTRAGS